MADWNLGSVAAGVLTLVDNVPTRLSGTPLEEMADRQRSYVEQRTGLSIGSNTISLKFQGPILHFTISEIVSQMMLDGADKGYKLGDFDVKANGSGGSNSSLADYYAMKAEKELRAIGFTARSGRTY